MSKLPREIFTLIDELCEDIDTKINLRRATDLGWNRLHVSEDTVDVLNKFLKSHGLVLPDEVHRSHRKYYWRLFNRGRSFIEQLLGDE